MTGTLSESARDRQKMIEENLGLVHSCAHRFKGRGIEYDDLFQAGCMGLVKPAMLLISPGACGFPPMRCR